VLLPEICGISLSCHLSPMSGTWFTDMNTQRTWPGHIPNILGCIMGWYGSLNNKYPGCIAWDVWHHPSMSYIPHVRNMVYQHEYTADMTRTHTRHTRVYNAVEWQLILPGSGLYWLRYMTSLLHSIFLPCPEHGLRTWIHSGHDPDTYPTYSGV
jgi:hypothetical protein